VTWLKQVRLRDDQKRQEQALRIKGYDDGYHGREASLRDAIYQASWRRGREAREQA
jgi:hypothetical protein